MRRILLIFLLLLPFLGCAQKLVPVVDLGEAWARSGPVAGPNAPLGDPESRPFLGAGWGQAAAEGYRPCRAKQAELYCYLDRPRALQLTLEGKASGVNQTAIQVLCNKQPVGVLVFKSLQSSFELKVPSEATLPGRNRITLSGAKGCLWKTVRITVKDSSAASCQRRPGEIRLPYGSTLSYPLELPASSRLVVRKLESWNAPGAAVSEGGLRVTLLTEDPLEEHHWTLENEGSLPLPAGRGALILEAISRQPPLPGQLGLIVSSAMLESKSEILPAGLEKGEPDPSQAFEPALKPNVILYLVDTLRADRLGCYGYDRGTTPAFDALAQDGIVFEQAWGESSWTKPSVATILSGTDARAHGAVEFADRVREDSPSLAQLLQKSGYSTIGLVANRWVSSTYGFARGFDSYELRAGEVADAMVAEACAQLEKRTPDKPFFLYLHTIDPHVPYRPPQPYAEKWAPGERGFGRKQMRNAQRLLTQSEALNRKPPDGFLPRLQRLYDGEVACNDGAFANLVEWLKEHELYDNTLIVVVSDHGEEFLEHGDLNHVQSLYQELLRVPLVVKMPAQAEAGSRVAHPVHHLDIAPTVLRQAGVAVPAQMPGNHLGLALPQARPLFAGVDVGSAQTVYEEGQRPYLYRGEAVRQGRFVLLKTMAARRSRHEPLELYDLEKDPQQKQNLLWARPVTALHLEKLLDREPRKPSEKAPKKAFQEDLRALMYVR